MMPVSSLVCDRTSDILRLNSRPLQSLLWPQSIAVLGTTFTPGTTSHTLLSHLLNAPFQGGIYPVAVDPPAGRSPALEALDLEIPVYSQLAQIPDPVDLAILVSPLKRVPELLRRCSQSHIPSAIAISPSWQERSPVDETCCREAHSQVGTGSIRLLGPDSLGLMNPRHGLNATLGSSLTAPGSIGFISQRGALHPGLLSWSRQEQVGFSAIVTTGLAIDIGWGDLIRYFGDDPYTESILLHVESIGDARSFLSAAREVAATKPIILLKSGHSSAYFQSDAAEVADDAAFSAALQRCGVLQVHRISELFNLAAVLAKRKTQVRGPRLGIVSNAGGLGGLAADALVAQGGQLADLSPHAVEQLSQISTVETPQNPVDLGLDADSHRYQQATEILLQDDSVDGLLIILNPQGRAEPTDTADRLKDTLNRLPADAAEAKPILTSWMGGAEVLAAKTIFNRHQIPTYAYPDSAARLFHLMWQHSYALKGLQEVPLPPPPPAGNPAADYPSPSRSATRQLIEAVDHQHRRILTPVEAARLLGIYGIPVLATGLAIDGETAVAEAEILGYPVVLKRPLRSDDVHRATTRLNLTSPEAVSTAFAELQPKPAQLGSPAAPTIGILQPMLQQHQGEALLLSSNTDPQLGPVIRFGQGRLQEPSLDFAIALPPLNRCLARRLLEQTRIYQTLTGPQKPPNFDPTVLEDLLVRFSQLVVEQPRIKAIDIAPIWVQPSWSATSREPSRLTAARPPLAGLVALDARIELHAPGLTAAELPPPAIRPYPAQYVHTYLGHGERITLRPLLPQDQQQVIEFYQTLPASMTPLTGLDHRCLQNRLRRLCYLDYDQDIALAAVRSHPAATPEILALGRLSRLPQPGWGELALLSPTSDMLPVEMLRQLVKIAQAAGLKRVITYLSSQQPELRQTYAQLNFQFVQRNGQMLAELYLSNPALSTRPA